MNRSYIHQGLRFIIILLVQVLILKRINVGSGDFNYFHLFLFPICLLLLPYNVPKIGAIFLGFFAGLILDMFYDTPGIHAACSVLLAFIRPLIHLWLEPRGGYTMNAAPTIRSMGNRWFLTYAGIGMGIYILCFFSLQAFSFVFILSIFLKSLFSFILSFILILIYMYVLQPEN
jgi:hypothetical protein